VSVECQFSYRHGKATCVACGRVCAAPHGRVRAKCPQPPQRARPHGPGTELKSLLKTIGIEATPNCSCNKRARIMDEKGCDWCEANIEEISGWLAEEAKKRNLPFIPLVGRTLVKIAVRRARKKGNSQ